MKLAPSPNGPEYGKYFYTYTREEWERRFRTPRCGARRLRSGSGSGLTNMQEAAIRASLELVEQGNMISFDGTTATGCWMGWSEGVRGEITVFRHRGPDASHQRQGSR